MNGTQVKNLRGDIVEDFDSDGDVGVLKNTKKELKIKNVGNDNLFVRVMVFPEIINNQGIYLPANIVHEIDGKKSGQIKLNDQAQEWIDGEDGYYYYTDKLKPNEFTSNLFKSITIDDSVLSSNKQENQGNTEYRYYSYEKSQLKMMIKEETITSRELVFQEAWGMKNDKNEFKNEKLKEINQKLEPLIDQK